MSAKTKRHHRASINECRKCWSHDCTCKEDRKKRDKRDFDRMIKEQMEIYDDDLRELAK